MRKESLKAHVVEYGARPKRSLGQVFLIERGIQKKILDLADLGPQDTVLEIGPGTGTLTREMLGRVGRLIALEIDTGLVSYLRGSLVHDGRLLLVCMDALDFDYVKAARRLNTPLKVVGNIPYGISAPLMFAFLDQWEAFSMLLLMVQKEVAQRLTASPGTKDYGILSVLCGIRFRIRIRQKVSRHCFSPVPRVDSAVIECLPRVDEPILPDEERALRRVVKASFSKRRKTLFNALRGSREIGLPDDRLRAVLEGIPIDPVRRPETLSPRDFLELSRCIRSASDAK